MQIILRRELTAHYSFSRDRIETCLQRISLSLTLYSNCVNIISHLNLTTRLCGCLWRRLGLEIIVSENKLIIKILTRVSNTVGLTWSLENSFCPTACWRLFFYGTPPERHSLRGRVQGECHTYWSWICVCCSLCACLGEAFGVGLGTRKSSAFVNSGNAVLTSRPPDMWSPYESSGQMSLWRFSKTLPRWSLLWLVMPHSPKMPTRNRAVAEALAHWRSVP